MNIYDIIIGVLLIWGLYRGYHDGVVVQLGGFVGVILGALLAYKFGATVGGWVRLDGTMASVVGFIIVLIAVVLGVAVLGRALKGLFKVAGLGVFDQLGGAVVSMLKVALVVSVILSGLEAINDKTNLLKPDKVATSALYKPVRAVTDIAFPYIDFLKQKLTEGSES